MIDFVIFSPVWRSGSTLVQRIFNANPATVVWGENGGVVTKFMEIEVLAGEFSDRANHESREFLSGPRELMWTANATPASNFVHSAVTSSMTAFLAALYGPRSKCFRRVGFKEVRYGLGEVQLIRRCFPEALFIFVVRNPLDAWSSMPEWGISESEFFEQWKRNFSGYIQFTATDSSSLIFNYDHISNKNPETMMSLSQASGITAEKVRDVVGVKIGSTIERRVNRKFESFDMAFRDLVDKIYNIPPNGNARDVAR